MQYLKLIVGAFAAMFILAACNSNDRNPVKAAAPAASPPTQTAQAPETSPSDGVRRVTTVELRDMIDKGQAVVIDVRTDDAYKTGHIKGARLIPATEILNHVGDLPRDKTIVTYCT